MAVSCCPLEHSQSRFKMLNVKVTSEWQSWRRHDTTTVHLHTVAVVCRKKVEFKSTVLRRVVPIARQGNRYIGWSWLSCGTRDCHSEVTFTLIATKGLKIYHYLNLNNVINEYNTDPKSRSHTTIFAIIRVVIFSTLFCLDTAAWTRFTVVFGYSFLFVSIKSYIWCA